MAAESAQEFEVMCSQWGLTEEKKLCLSFLIAAVQIDTVDAYLFCEHYHWNLEQIQEHMFDESVAEEWKKKREARAAEAERRKADGDDEEELFLVKADTEEPKREILVQCKCGSEMIVTTPRESYPDFNNVARCDMCATLISGDDFIYYCSRGRSPDHKLGYDLCVSCAHKKFPKAAKIPLRLATASGGGKAGAKPPPLVKTASMLEVPQIAVGRALEKHRRSLLAMLHHSYGSDVKFIVGREKTEFNSHSLFLAASSDYWAEKLTSDGRCKSEMQTVELPSVSPAAFQCILSFAYGSHPKVTPLTVVETRYLSTVYGMDTLTEACENYFDVSVDDGLCDVLTGVCDLEKRTKEDSEEQSDSLKELIESSKKSCIEALEMCSKVDLEQLLKSGGFKRMTIEAMQEFLRCDRLKIDEDVLWRAVLDWSEKQAQRGRLIQTKSDEVEEEKCDVSMSGKKEDYLVEVKSLIRFGLMSETFWTHSVKKFLDSRVDREILTSAEITTIEAYYSDASLGCGDFSTKARGL